jgi:hypothetical protein
VRKSSASVNHIDTRIGTASSTTCNKKETVKVLRCEVDGIWCEVRKVRFRSIRLPKENAGTGESRRRGEAFGKKIWPGSIAGEGGWITAVLMGYSSFEVAVNMNGSMDLRSAAGHRGS